MEIKKNLVTPDKYSIKCPYNMTPKGICVHNTGNNAPAVNEIAYMIRNNNQVSFHFAVDGNEVWQGIPVDRNAWHAGDGGNGDGNRNYIAIEICYSKNGGDKFTKAEKNAAKFIAELLKERNWGIDRVKTHRDFSGKYCPHRTLDMGWQRFLNMVQAELDALNGKKEPVGDDFFPPKGYFALGDTHANIGKIADFMYRVFPAYTDKKALGNYYGKYIQSSIKEFQRRTGLVKDGIVGQQTLAELEKYGFKK
jgi:N-acetylmuramoyl-L-alanine amidase CwlA